MGHSDLKTSRNFEIDKDRGDLFRFGVRGDCQEEFFLREQEVEEAGVSMLGFVLLLCDRLIFIIIYIVSGLVNWLTGYNLAVNTITRLAAMSQQLPFTFSISCIKNLPTLYFSDCCF